MVKIEKKTKKFFIIVLLIFLLIMVSLRVNYLRKEESSVENELQDKNMMATMKAVVVGVYDNSLMVVDCEDKELIDVGFAKEGNIGFKQGQEIVVYFDGLINLTYPGQINRVGKIEIIKDKSTIEIPKEALRYCYSSRENVEVSVNELTNNSIALDITDTNEIPYNYSHSYSITQKVKNKEYTGIGEKFGEDTKTSTSGYTRKRT